MLCSSETVTDQAMPRQEALVQQQNGKGKGCQVPADGLGFLLLGRPSGTSLYQIRLIFNTAKSYLFSVIQWSEIKPPMISSLN
jgi:hypothetical protein